MNEQARSISDRTAAARDGASSGINAQLMIVLGALALTALLYWPTSLEIAAFWEDTARRRYTHGWAVLAVTAWLIWRDRVALRSIPLAPPRGGWIVVALAGLAWLVGFNAGLLVPTMLVMPVLVLVAIWATGGVRLALRVAFPVLFLYFALPVWDVIDLPLQSLTAAVSLSLVRLAGIPATTDGYVIHIPEGWFEIASSCNGLHFLIVALAIAAVHGHVDRDHWRSRLLLFAIAAGLALLINWLRVFIVIVVGHLTDMQHFLVRVDHYYFGWVLFAFTLILYVYLSSRLPRRGSTAQAQERLPAPVNRRPLILAVVLSTAALALGPVRSLYPSMMIDDATNMPPPPLDGWAGPEPYASDWRPVFANADEEFLASYRNEPARAIALYRAAYHAQRQGKELRGYGNSVVGHGYRVKVVRGHDAIVAARVVPVLEQTVVSADGDEWLIWSLFAFNGRPDPMGLKSQVWYGVRSLVSAPTVSVIALGAECRPDCDLARSALADASGKALPILLPALHRNGADSH